ncbi:response regulator [Paenibacillus doosanensis]|uniref:response regulator n=1 Tax=Paenibacillus doosanensis TaxID=1229154 RepID=UPI00217F591B|nr:response regulator [Paenibacillus doosanensis]MCS7463854.1 response regulator [Paenibacillus doosanensis]
MKVAIVDDEPQIRRWIEQLVHKTELGIEVAGAYGNGKEALDACRSQPVDVIITDIKMPVMDGIELIRRLKEEFPSVRSMIMSSYSEFQYASEALKAGAGNYILKAEVTVGELREALNKLQSELALEKHRNDEVYSLKSALNHHHHTLRSIYLTDLVRGKPSAIHEFEAKMSAFQLRLPRRDLIVMTIRPDDAPDAGLHAKIKDHKLLESAMVNIIDETLVTEAGSGCCFVYEANLLVVLIGSNQTGSRSVREASLQYAHRIISNLSEYLQVSVSVGISPPYGDLSQLGHQFQEACEALKRKTFYEKRAIAWHKEEQAADTGFADKELPAFWKTFTQRIGERQYKQAAEAVEALMGGIQQRKPFTEAEAKALCLQIAFTLHQALRDLKEGAAVYEPELIHQEIAELSTFERLKQWLLLRTAHFIDEAQVRQGSYNKTIREVCAFIKESYAEGISLQQAADKVHLNKTYLSELFKKKMGVSFNDYLTHLRIEKVKELIRSGDSTIGMMAEQVGYPDGSYLTKVFKKATGMTPLEYKQAHAMR